MNSYEETLLHYATTLLTKEQLQVIADNDVPLYGVIGLRKYLAEISIDAFVKLYLPDEFTLDFAPIHHTMIQDVQEIRDRQVQKKTGRKYGRAIPRGHAKSTFYSRILPLHGLLFGWSNLTVLFGNNDDAAKRLVTNIKNVIETNAAILQDFPNIKGTSWGNEKLQASNGATIMAFGVGSGSSRGVSIGQHRPSLIILDDIDDDKSVRSAVELANNKEWLDKNVMALGDNIAFTTAFVAVGTIIRKTSLMKYMLESPDFDSVIESAVKHFAAHSQLWDEWRDRILDLARNNNQPKDASEDTFYQEHKEEMLEGTEMLWNRPDAHRQAMLFKLRNEAAFYSELQNAPKDTNGTFGEI